MALGAYYFPNSMILTEQIFGADLHISRSPSFRLKEEKVSQVIASSPECVQLSMQGF